MEEYLWPEEPLVANVYVECGIVDGIVSLVVLDPLRGVTVVFIKLFGNIGTNVTVAFCKNNYK